MSLAQIAPTLTSPLGLGSSGPDVKALQNMLNEARLGPVISTDGRFGKATHKALLAFQKSKGVKPDGVVGPKTAKLFGFEYRPGRVLPYVISFEEPARPAMTSPLKVLLEMILTGMKPVHQLVRDAMFSTPTVANDARINLKQIGFVDEEWYRLKTTLSDLAEKVPDGALAAATLRKSLQTFVESMAFFSDTMKWHARGGYMWRIPGVLQKVPIDVIVGVGDRVLRGEQNVSVALAQLQLTFQNLKLALDQMPRTDANGVAY